MCKKSCGSFLTGIVLGTLVGGAVALLYAPVSGREARKILRKKALEAKKKALEARDDLLEGVAELKKKAQEEMKDFEHRTKRAVCGAAKAFKKK